MINPTENNTGFTLIEVLLVMGLFAVLTGFIGVNLIRPQIRTSIDRTTNTLVADLKQQQLKSMIGDDAGTSFAQTHGVHFETNQYTVFRGANYSASEPSNFVVPLEGGTTLTSINFPSSQIVFSRNSGDFSNYLSGSDNLTITHPGGLTTVITLNRYGTIEIN